MKCIIIPRISHSNLSNLPIRVKSAGNSNRRSLSKLSIAPQPYIKKTKKSTIGIQCDAPETPNFSVIIKPKTRHHISKSLLIEPYDRNEYVPYKKRTVERPKIFNIIPLTADSSPKKLGKIQSTKEIIRDVKPNLLLYKIRSISSSRRNQIFFKSIRHSESTKILRIVEPRSKSPSRDQNQSLIIQSQLCIQRQSKRLL